MLPGLVLSALVLAAATATSIGRAGAALLALTSVAWLVVNEPMEGRVLFVVSNAHGFTAGDLAGLTGLFLAVAIVIRSYLRD